MALFVFGPTLRREARLAGSRAGAATERMRVRMRMRMRVRMEAA